MNQGNIHYGGNFLVFRAWGTPSDAEGTDIQLLRIEQDSASVLASMDVPNNRIRPRDCGITLGGRSPVFTPEIEWAAASDYVAVATTAAYTIDFFDTGALTRIIRRAIDPVPATEAAGLRQLGGGISVGMVGRPGGTGQRGCSGAAMLEAQGMAAFIPAVKRMAMAPDGALWVQWWRDDETTSIDVFDSDGEYIGTLPEDSPFPIMFLPGNKIGAAETDDSGVSRLVVYAVLETSVD